MTTTNAETSEKIESFWVANVKNIVTARSYVFLKGERKTFLKNCELTSYAIIFGQITFFSIIKLVFRGKRGFYLFHYNAVFKDRVLFK